MDWSAVSLLGYCFLGTVVVSIVVGLDVVVLVDSVVRYLFHHLPPSLDKNGTAAFLENALKWLLFRVPAWFMWGLVAVIIEYFFVVVYGSWLNLLVNLLCMWEFAKSRAHRALRAPVPSVPFTSRALRAFYIPCSRALRAFYIPCSRALRAFYIPVMVSSQVMISEFLANKH